MKTKINLRNTVLLLYMHDDVRLVHTMREHYTLFSANYICQTFIISCISVSIIIFLQFFRLVLISNEFYWSVNTIELRICVNYLFFMYFYEYYMH